MQHATRLHTTLASALFVTACADPSREGDEVLTTEPLVLDDDGGASSGDDVGEPPIPAADGSSTGAADGNLPCEGCAGDVCASNNECVDGFVCTRLNDEVAWCSNCSAVFSCESSCTADVNCGEGGVCHDGLCWHGCIEDDDCPDGHSCFSTGERQFCAPLDLPALDDECVASAAGWCESFVEGNGTCVYTGTDFQSDPGENWCSKGCSTNTDCTDVWPLGCCSADGVFAEGSNYCLRPEYAGSCM